jgi:hypothetical protein
VDDTSDYSYDEAHEAAPARGAPDRHPGTERRGAAPATGDRDPDGDYGYDLAHDVSRPERDENRGR